VLNDQQAYFAMFAFLEAHYRRGPTDVVGSLLGALSLLPDGSPADPGVVEDWQAACNAARAGLVDPKMELK
jgi:hypothetical protein